MNVNYNSKKLFSFQTIILDFFLWVTPFVIFISSCHGNLFPDTTTAPTLLFPPKFSWSTFQWSGRTSQSSEHALKNRYSLQTHHDQLNSIVSYKEWLCGLKDANQDYDIMIFTKQSQNPWPWSSTLNKFLSSSTHDEGLRRRGLRGITKKDHLPMIIIY